MGRIRLFCIKCVTTAVGLFTAIAMKPHDWHQLQLALTKLFQSLIPLDSFFVQSATPKSGEVVRYVVLIHGGVIYFHNRPFPPCSSAVDMTRTSPRCSWEALSSFTRIEREHLLPNRNRTLLVRYEKRRRQRTFRNYA